MLWRTLDWVNRGYFQQVNRKAQDDTLYNASHRQFSEIKKKIVYINY